MDRNNKIIAIRPGEVITAQRLNSMARNINANTSAVAKPWQKDVEIGSSTGLSDETFTAEASDITSTTVTITDSASNTHDIERIDTIVFTEATTGRQITLDINYT